MNELREWAKETARVILVAIIPIVIISLETNSIDWKIIAVTGVIAGLRAVEKVLHKKDSRYQLPI